MVIDVTYANRQLAEALRDIFEPRKREAIEKVIEEAQEKVRAEILKTAAECAITITEIRRVNRAIPECRITLEIRTPEEKTP